MRPPRNFDAAAARQAREPQTRINDRIRVREVLLIDEDDNDKGVTKVEDAQRYALERNLDLVEISPQARPPVCKVMDYGKWKYEQNLKAKQARKHRSQVTIKEIKFRPKIGVADYETKKNHVRRFLEAGDRVKVTIMFRGREVVHSDLGRKILERVSVDVADVGTIDQHPNLEGRNMIMMLAPVKERVAKSSAEDGDAGAASANGSESVNGAAPAGGAEPATPEAAVADDAPAEAAE